MFKRMQILLGACALLALLVATPVLADGDDEHRVTIVDADGYEHVLTFSGNAMEIISEADGEVSVHSFNFSSLEPLVEDAVSSALTGLDEAMAELEALDLNIHMDGDMVVVEQGDSVHAVNLQFLSDTVGDIVGEMMADFDGGIQVYVDDDDDDYDDDTELLRAEVKALKEELRRLADELAEQR